ncbi:DUF1465 family protein [Sphingomonas hankookensis]|uniref:DUF1465 family protein n=1 Tax=Sphingomonas hankookensis TaxID=563996 RepID=UPI003D302FA6
MELRATATDARRRLIDSLYVEAMLLADEARAYFNEDSRGDRAALDPMARVVLSCEIAQDHDPVDACHRVAADPARDRCGEIAAELADDPLRGLATPPATGDDVLATMPAGTGALIRASIDLYRRAERIERSRSDPPAASPARAMLDRLAMQL